MSRRKIKSPTKVQKQKQKQTGIDGQMLHLLAKRAQRQTKEIEQVEDLIADGKLDPYKIEDYDYVSSVARDLKWSVGKLRKTIRLAKVEEIVKKEATNAKADSTE